MLWFGFLLTPNLKSRFDTILRGLFDGSADSEGFWLDFQQMLAEYIAVSERRGCHGSG